jgi:hypothetical protein
MEPYLTADQQKLNGPRGLSERAGCLLGRGISWEIPGVPRYLAGVAGQGLIGAGLGYGAGWLGSRLMPKSWNNDGFPKTLAILGGLAGASPGASVFAQNAIQVNRMG